MKLCVGLARAGNYTRATEVLDIYFSAFMHSSHPNVLILKGDVLRNIARISGQRSVGSAALSLYEQAQQQQQIPTVDGRLASARQFIDSEG